ncbi:MAG: HYR domain-containing protein [Saprospiraceae bacterium]|nr:HYR domain-containing protein [Saprospiraceae bacterium]
MFFNITRTVFALFLVWNSVVAFSQNPDCPQTTFFKTLGNENQAEYGTVLIRSGDGNLYLAGRNGNKTFIQKTSSGGQPIWLREFQISPFEPITPVQIIVDSEGMIVGCGTQSQFAGVRRGFVFRYDPVADSFLWAHPVVSNNPNAAGIIEKSPGDGYVYFQNPVLTDGETDIEILNLERTTGAIIPAFASRYEFISHDVLTKMISVEGSLFAIGTAGSRPGSGAASLRRPLLTRIDPVNGMPIWASLSHLDTTQQADLYGRDLAVDGDALLAVYAGDEDVNNPGATYIYLQKTDLDGNIFWVKRYELGSNFLRLQVVADGYIISGQISTGNENFVFKVNKNGDFIWGRNLTYGPAANINSNNLGPDQSVLLSDSLYITGFATGNNLNVMFWKMLSDGAMVDSCGLMDTLTLQSEAVANPLRLAIPLQQLLSTAVLSNVDVPWTSNTLAESLQCPFCEEPPNPCPEGVDFTAFNYGAFCVDGDIHLGVIICDLEGGTIPEMDVTFYDGNPFLTDANKIVTLPLTLTIMPDSCTTLNITDLVGELGQQYIQDGATIYWVVNDSGNNDTPFSPDEFPLSIMTECNYYNNLDSTILDLPESPTLHLGDDLVICPGETVTLDAGAGYYRYQWSNGQSTQTVTVGTAGLYRVTVTDDCGFRQFDTVALQVRQQPFKNASGSFCPGKSVTVLGFTFDQAGTYQETIPGVGTDCDTVVTFDISELPYEEKIEQVFFCPFETVTINGVTYEDSGIARDTIFSTDAGCDTIILYFLNQLPLPFRNYQFNICPGDSVVFNGNVYTQSTGFTDTLYSTGIGCDTVAYVSITLHPQVTTNETIQFCPGSSVVLGGQTYTQPGLVTVLLPNSNPTGCDTIANYTLEWLPAPELTETIQFCPGTSVVIDGVEYYQPGTVTSVLPGGGGGCDTVIIYTLEWLPQTERFETVQFCPGTSVEIDGEIFTQPGQTLLTIPSTTGGCDTLVTITLEWLPLNTRAETVSFCPGGSVVIGGNTYNSPGTVLDTIPSQTAGCDTVVTYTLELLPPNTRAETIEFCEGESVVVNGQTYNQPATVVVTQPGANGACDTVVTYTLQYVVTSGSSLTLNCPAAISVASTPGTGPVVVNYNQPTVASDCVCPGIDLSLTSGLASGSLFPVGTTQVCYAAQDSCGSDANCCFTVIVREEQPCDTKTSGCVKYELLALSKNAQQQVTYRIRVTNNCTNKLIYTAIQLPAGVTAVAPANLSNYVSPDGRNYSVRNPNYTPFYSIRFKSTSDSIANGESDVFEYTLPAQSQVTFINITSRLEPQVFYAAHLNTFNCPVGTTTQNQNREEDLSLEQWIQLEHPVVLFPNPSSGELYGEFSRWEGQALQIQVLDSRGRRVQLLNAVAAGEPQPIALEQHLPSGMYFLEVAAANGEREVLRFVLEK